MLRRYDIYTCYLPPLPYRASPPNSKSVEFRGEDVILSKKTLCCILSPYFACKMGGRPSEAMSRGAERLNLKCYCVT